MVFYPKLKKKNKKRRTIDLVKITKEKEDFLPDFKNQCFEVKFDFEDSSKSWQKNKIKVFSPNGFCVGYIYK